MRASPFDSTLSLGSWREVSDAVEHDEGTGNA
jgi:hypothetical protein